MSDAPRTGHLYDGIEEYDNPLPGWWKWLFIATIAFCPFYWFYYHSGVPGRSVEDQYETAQAANTRLQFAEIGVLNPDAVTITKYMYKENWVRVGKTVFKTNCISCHGKEGEGQIGPNLTDESFKNIQHIEDIASVVIKGAGNGAMPAWANRLHPNEIVLVSAYVASLRGQDLSGPRGAEGRAIAPWPEPQPEAEADTGSEPNAGSEPDSGSPDNTVAPNTVAPNTGNPVEAR